MLRFWLKSGPAQGVVSVLLIGGLLIGDMYRLPTDAPDHLLPLASLAVANVPSGWAVLTGYALLCLSYLAVYLQYAREAGGMRSALPMLLALLWALLTPIAPGEFLIGSVALLLMALSVRFVLCENRVGLQTSLTHRAGAQIGLATLLYSPMWPFGLLPLVALFYRGGVTFGRIFLLLAGLIIPACGVAVCGYLLDFPPLSYLPNPSALLPLGRPPLAGIRGAFSWPAMVLWGVILLLWVVYVSLDRKPRAGRVSSYLLGRGILRTWVLLALCAAFIAPDPRAAQLLAGLPLGVMLARFFSEKQGARFMRWLFTLLLVATLLIAGHLRLSDIIG